MRALVPLLSVAVLGLAACGGTASAPEETPSPSLTPTVSAVATPLADPTPTPEPVSCEMMVERLTPEEQIGQLFMVGMTSTAPVDEAYRTMLTDSHAGAIVLLGDSSAERGEVRELTDTLRAAASQPQDIGLLVAVDQEGGAVQRLRGAGFENMPSARVQANRPIAELERSAQHWGGQLEVAGIKANLAPVADVVPEDQVAHNEPIGKLNRHYGTTPEEVTPRVEAMVRGYHQAGIATSLKHFPGLGHVVGNTDFTGNVADTTVGRNHPDLEPFSAGIQAGSDMVMVSTASYERLDPGVPAAFSSTIINTLLRQGMSFDGVVIADDLGAAQQVADVAPGDRAVRFLTAGGDLVINGDPALQAEMTEAVRALAAEDLEFAEQVRKKATRVVMMKARHGVAPCQVDPEQVDAGQTDAQEPDSQTQGE